MQSLLNLVETLSEKILEHYEDKLKGIVIGGEAIDTFDEKKTLLILLVLDKVHKISFYAREEIAEYFIKKIEPLESYFEYVKKYGQRPLLYFIILDPSELSFHNPIVLYLLTNGKVLFDKEKLIEKEVKKVNVTNINGVLKLSEINKGEVIEL
ncbi:hypothetical protein [Sulfurisphaera tokodaii]|uniref:Uncharacterized protein n=2 Tax=Sulfurisphaera tokodaii TaxID=111955 RepID=Q974W9_SULTO|nr:hypothetical protein [Sulfurisphaera tokodaii]BAB65538.1 hypothetical protein STK_05410 [Sulfurisphaera tokodaii str. 7]HII74761.1 hypothetical protein [Sulfurisphaera tokodaii]